MLVSIQVGNYCHYQFQGCLFQVFLLTCFSESAFLYLLVCVCVHDVGFSLHPGLHSNTFQTKRISRITLCRSNSRRARRNRRRGGWDAEEPPPGSAEALSLVPGDLDLGQNQPPGIGTAGFSPYPTLTNRELGVVTAGFSCFHLPGPETAHLRAEHGAMFSPGSARGLLVQQCHRECSGQQECTARPEAQESRVRSRFQAEAAWAVEVFGFKGNEAESQTKLSCCPGAGEPFWNRRGHAGGKRIGLGRPSRICRGLLRRYAQALAAAVFRAQQVEKVPWMKVMWAEPDVITCTRKGRNWHYDLLKRTQSSMLSPPNLLTGVVRFVQAGLDAMRESGKIPRGPPDLPTGPEPRFAIT